MLYDPKWSDPLKLPSLIAWLQTKPADEGYNYYSCYRCALAQYFTSVGYKRVNVGSMVFRHSEPWGWLFHWRRRQALPEGWNGLAWNGGGGHTYGAMLARASAAYLRSRELCATDETAASTRAG